MSQSVEYEKYRSTLRVSNNKTIKIDESILGIDKIVTKICISMYVEKKWKIQTKRC